MKIKLGQMRPGRLKSNFKFLHEAKITFIRAGPDLEIPACADLYCILTEKIPPLAAAIFMSALKLTIQETVMKVTIM